MSVNKITVADIEQVVKKTETIHHTFEWAHGLTVDVAYSVPFSTELAIIEAVAQSCFDEEGNYFPALVDMMFRHEVIAKYTNIELPEGVEACHTLLYDTDLWDYVTEYTDDAQLAHILTSAHEMIKHRNDIRVELLKQNVESLVESFSRVAGAFDGVSATDIKGIFGAITNGGIDESKIVNAILEHGKEATK